MSPYPLPVTRRDHTHFPRYRLPACGTAGAVWSVLALRPRSFALDARRAMAHQNPVPSLLGTEHIPRSGPCLVTCNHYTRPGFDSWWLVIAVTNAIAAYRASGADPQLHWVMAGAWSFPGSKWRHRVLTPLTRCVFERVARVYGFVTMPPMPPDPGEVEQRAAAVLRTVRLGRRLVQTGGMLALAPEGRDVPDGLGEPPDGVGDFIALLAEIGFPVLPVAVSEPGGRLTISFGATFAPVPSTDRATRDAAVARQVMDAIARQLPPSV